MTSFKERSWLKKRGAREVAELAFKVGRLRMVGDCVQYPLVCRGVLDAAVDPLMKPWDIAAIVPCILEAGGVISDLAGESSDDDHARLDGGGQQRRPAPGNLSRGWPQTLTQCYGPAHDPHR